MNTGRQADTQREYTNSEDTNRAENMCCQRTQKGLPKPLTHSQAYITQTGRRTPRRHGPAMALTRPQM